FRRVRENRRAILRAEVRSLAIYLRRIVHVPERFDKRFVAHFLRIKSYLHNFRVSGLVSADILVRGIFSAAIAITDGRVHNSGNHPKLHFHSPETASGKSSEFSHRHSFLSYFIIVTPFLTKCQMPVSWKGFRRFSSSFVSYGGNWIDAGGAKCRHVARKYGQRQQKAQ